MQFSPIYVLFGMVLIPNGVLRHELGFSTIREMQAGKPLKVRAMDDAMAHPLSDFNVSNKHDGAR